MLTITNENGRVTIKLTGRVDSSNAPDLEKQIWDQVDFTSCKDVTVDAEELVMISSAGLRIMLKMRKLCPTLKVLDANPDVYEVFDMTGFTEMMTVKKAYRKLSVEGCEVLGEGSNGIVYRYDPEIVVKAYKKADALAEIEKERRLARKALVLGIPTAIPFDVVKVGNTYGSVFELLNARSFSKLIAAEPDNLEKYIGIFVDLLKKIHSTEVEKTDLEDIKTVALGWADYLKDHLPKDQCEKLTQMIAAVPERNTMIHGDYHTNNVQMQGEEVLLIDMDTLSYGHPIFELAPMYLAFVGFGDIVRDRVELFMKVPYDTAGYIWRRSLELYFDTTDKAFLTGIEDKAKTLGYARLLRRTIKRIGYDDPEGRATIDHCKAMLTDLLSRVDSLDF